MIWFVFKTEKRGKIGLTIQKKAALNASKQILLLSYKII